MDWTAETEARARALRALVEADAAVGGGGVHRRHAAATLGLTRAQWAQAVACAVEAGWVTVAGRGRAARVRPVAGVSP